MAEHKIKKQPSGTFHFWNAAQLIENELLKPVFTRSTRSIFGTPKHKEHPLPFHFWNEWNA